MPHNPMSRSERRSLYRFMMIYLFSTLVLFGVGATIFYRFEVYQMEENARRALKSEADHILPIIRNADIQKISAITTMKVAIYNGNKQYLFGTFAPTEVQWNDHFQMRGEVLRHVRVIPPPHRKHTAFLVVEQQLDRTPIRELRHLILYASVLMLLVVMVLGYFLGRLFIAPMREALHKINLFVQDTTHELNTPISTILTNIEMMEILGKCEKNEELQRIEIASKTLSRIYEDLSYLKLNEEYQRRVEPVDLSRLLEERMTYFSSLMDAKGITLSCEIAPGVIREIDRGDAIRLFDNLLSNAIKYNDREGSVNVALSPEKFSIEDSGRGMSPKVLKTVFERFERGDSSEGGFGIGLDIVSQVCSHYGFEIEIDSVEGNGTTVIVKIVH
jgi:two-component system OmpR family sensor kinase